MGSHAGLIVTVSEAECRQASLELLETKLKCQGNGMLATYNVSIWFKLSFFREVNWQKDISQILSWQVRLSHLRSTRLLRHLPPNRCDGNPVHHFPRQHSRLHLTTTDCLVHFGINNGQLSVRRLRWNKIMANAGATHGITCKSYTTLCYLMLQLHSTSIIQEESIVYMTSANSA